MIKFGERIKVLRLECGLSQRDLAKELGYTQPAIARWENGLQVANIDVLMAYSKFFKVSADYLLGLED